MLLQIHYGRQLNTLLPTGGRSAGKEGSCLSSTTSYGFWDKRQSGRNEIQELRSRPSSPGWRSDCVERNIKRLLFSSAALVICLLCSTGKIFPIFLVMKEILSCVRLDEFEPPQLKG